MDGDRSVGVRTYPELVGLGLALLWMIIAAASAFAQDMKAVSASLASRIAASGRKTVAVIDFTDLQGNVTELGRFLAEELSVDLVNDAKGFEVIDRTHLKSILQEHKLATTGLIDPKTARKLGQIAGVDALVTGTITPLGDSVRLSAKVLDTTTARMFAASTVEIPRTKAIEDLLGRGIGGAHPASPESALTGSADASGGKAAKAVSVEENGLLFILKGCWGSGGTVSLRDPIGSPRAQRPLSARSSGRTSLLTLGLHPVQAPQQKRLGSSGRTVSCAGSITNKTYKRRQVALWVGSSAVDDLGNQYPVLNVTLGSEGTGQELEPDLPVNFSLSVNDVDPRATHVSIVVSYLYAPGMGAKLLFRNIPIQQK